MAKGNSKKQTITQFAMGRFGKSFLSSYRWIAIFICLALLCFLGFAYLGVGLSIFILLLGLPTFFAAQLCSEGQLQSQKPTFSHFLYYFGAYFRVPFKGVYRAIRSILIAIIFFAISAIAVLLTMLNVDPNLNGSLNYLYTSFSPSATGQWYTEINMNPSLHSFFYMAYGISYGVGAFAFIICLLINGLNVHLRGRMFSTSSRESNMVFSRTIGGNRLGFYRDILKIGWPILALFAIGYAGSMIIFFDRVRTPSSLAAISLVFGLVLASPGILYYFLGLRYIWFHGELLFLTTLIEMISAELDSASRDPRFPKESIEAARHAEEELRKVADRIKESRREESDEGLNQENGPNNDVNEDSSW